MAPRRRLARITAHLQGAALRRPRTGSVAAEPDPKPLLLDDGEMKEFIKSGVHMISPGSPGMPDASVHYANWEDACAMQESATAGVHSIADNVIASVPGVRDVLESPAVRGVLQSVLGKGYTYHPHHFMHMTSPQTDQFWYGFSPSLAPSIVLTACGAVAPGTKILAGRGAGARCGTTTASRPCFSTTRWTARRTSGRRCSCP